MDFVKMVSLKNKISTLILISFAVVSLLAVSLLHFGGAQNSNTNTFIYASTGVGGSITPSGNISVAFGGSQTFTHYKLKLPTAECFGEWDVNGSPKHIDDPRRHWTNHSLCHFSCTAKRSADPIHWRREAITGSSNTQN